MMVAIARNELLHILRKRVREVGEPTSKPGKWEGIMGKGGNSEGKRSFSMQHISERQKWK